MSDNRRQYQTIQKALKTCYPMEPEGHLARHLTTLAGLVSGIVSTKRPHLSKIAAQVPDASLAEKELGWSPRTSFPELVSIMVDAELERVRQKKAARRYVGRESVAPLLLATSAKAHLHPTVEASGRARSLHGVAVMALMATRWFPRRLLNRARPTCRKPVVLQVVTVNVISTRAGQGMAGI